MFCHLAFLKEFLYPFYRFLIYTNKTWDSLVFKGGVFNLRALIIKWKEILLIAKSQSLPWYKAIGENRKYYLQGSSTDNFRVDFIEK